jgi:hypothetical protein
MSGYRLRARPQSSKLEMRLRCLYPLHFWRDGEVFNANACKAFHRPLKSDSRLQNFASVIHAVEFVIRTHDNSVQVGTLAPPM